VIVLLQMFSWFWQWNSLQNRLIFHEVKAYKNCAGYFGPPCSALTRSISKALRYGPCVTRRSHSFTCHPHTNHNCLYSPAARRHRSLAGTHCAYTKGWPGWVDLCGWLLHNEINVPHREMNPDTVLIVFVFFFSSVSMY